MGHYDNCRDGHCAVCGQTGNLCGHNATHPKKDAEPMNAKTQYMQFRALRKTLCLDQIAFYAPGPLAEAEIKNMLGLANADWTEDYVTGDVKVFGGDPSVSKAKLQFNYDLGIEVEILTYLEGPNWHRERERHSRHNDDFEFNPRREAFVSHLGFHVNDEDMPLLPWRVAQSMITTFHSNPAIAGRSYEYVIYDTKDMLGVDLKYIKRRF